MGMVRVKSEIAGKVWKLLACVGEPLAQDADILLIESMKMEIPVAAPVKGMLKELLVGEGDEVSEGQDLAEIET